MLSKDKMKNPNSYIDFENDEIIRLNKKIAVKFTISDDYGIPREKIVDGNHDYFLKSESVLYCDNMNGLSNESKNCD